MKSNQGKYCNKTKEIYGRLFEYYNLNSPCIFIEHRKWNFAHFNLCHFLGSELSVHKSPVFCVGHNLFLVQDCSARGPQQVYLSIDEHLYCTGRQLNTRQYKL